MHERFSIRDTGERLPLDRRRVLWSYEGVLRALTRVERLHRASGPTGDARTLEPYLAWADRKRDHEWDAEPLALRRFSLNVDLSMLPEDLVLRFSPPSWALDQAQLRALTRSLLPVSFVWGQPSTGPLALLGAVAAMHAAMGHQVFLLTPTPATADEVSRVVESMMARLFGAALPGAVVRAASPVGADLAGSCGRALVVVATVEDAFLDPALRALACDDPDAVSGRAPAPTETCRALIRWLREHPMEEERADVAGPVGVPMVAGRRRTLIFHGANAIPRFRALPLFDVPVHHVILTWDPRETTPALPAALAGDSNARFWLEESLFDAAGYHDGEECRRALAARGALTVLAPVESVEDPVGAVRIDDRERPCK